MLKRSAWRRQAAGSYVGGVEAVDHGAQALHALVGEELAGHAGRYRVQRAAAGKGNHRSAGAHGFHRRDAEILQPWEEKRLAAVQQFPHALARLAAQEGDVGRRLRLPARPGRGRRPR